MAGQGGLLGLRGWRRDHRGTPGVRAVAGRTGCRRGAGSARRGGEIRAGRGRARRARESSADHLTTVATAPARRHGILPGRATAGAVPVRRPGGDPRRPRLLGVGRPPRADAGGSGAAGLVDEPTATETSTSRCELAFRDAPAVAADPSAAAATGAVEGVDGAGPPGHHRGEQPDGTGPPRPGPRGQTGPRPRPARSPGVPRSGWPARGHGADRQSTPADSRSRGEHGTYRKGDQPTAQFQARCVTNSCPQATQSPCWSAVTFCGS